MLKKIVFFFAVLSIWELILGLNGGIISVGGLKIRQILLLINLVLFLINNFYYSKRSVAKLDKVIIISMFTIFLIGILWTAYGILFFSNKFALTEGISFVSVIHIYFIYSACCGLKINQKSLFCIFQLPLLMLFSIISFFWLSGLAFNIDNSWIFEMFNDPGGSQIILGAENSSGRFYFQNTVLLLLSSFIFTIESKRMSILYYYLYLFLYAISMLAIGSRGIAIGCSILLLLSFSARNIRLLSSKKILTLFISVSFLSVLIIFISPLVSDFVYSSRFFDSNVSSLSDSDITRFEQFNFLFHEFEQQPILGHGLGYYVSGYIRSESNPYAYELFFVALLMKIGILGSLLFIVSLLILFIPILYGKNKFTFLTKTSYIIIMTSIVFMVSTNPVLITPVGFLLLFSPWFYLKLRQQSISEETLIG